jgi:hypothetical protein
MLLHLPIAIAATLSPIVVSAAVPQFDIARECRFEGGSIVEFGRCSEDERAAFLELQNAWMQFAGADKKNCVASTRIGGFASYVELLVCLKMARDAENEYRGSRGPQTTEAMRPHAPGVTVGLDTIRPRRNRRQAKALARLPIRSASPLNEKKS